MAVPSKRKLLLKPIASVISHHYLLRNFVVKDIRGRFVGSMGGNLWVVLNPLATIASYLFIFSIVLRVTVSAAETGTDNFTIYFLAGFFPWFMFAESLSRSVVVLIENADLITKVSFPVELLPAGAVLSSYIINGVGMLCFLVFLAVAGYLDWSWLWVLYVVAAQIIFTWGLSKLLAALCVFIRDMKELLAIILMIWFYGTPIVYPIGLLPDTMQAYMQLNPMWNYIALYRDILLKHEVNPYAILSTAVLALVSYGIGAWFFMRSKNAFGDVL